MCLDVQLKSTTAATVTPKTVQFDLPVKNFDDLRADTEQERILAVLVLPVDEARWIRHTESGLLIRTCMYWASLRGRPGVTNRSTVRITIDRKNQFTPDALQWIMDCVRIGEELT